MGNLARATKILNVQTLCLTYPGISGICYIELTLISLVRNAKIYQDVQYSSVYNGKWKQSKCSRIREGLITL